MKRILFSVVLTASFSLSTSVNATSEDACGFGYVLIPAAYDEVTDTYADADSCEKSTWTWLSNNDGFSSSVAVYIDADVTSYEDDIEVTTTLQIQCRNRRLNVYVSTDPLDMYPDTNLRGVGTAQVRIDSKKIQNFTYEKQSDYSGVLFSNSKKLTTAILSGKSKIRIKIGGINGYNVSAFPKGDLASYASKFKKKGCPLK
jgi:hypothetical protein